MDLTRLGWNLGECFVGFGLIVDEGWTYIHDYSGSPLFILNHNNKNI